MRARATGVLGGTRSHGSSVRAHVSFCMRHARRRKHICTTSRGVLSFQPSTSLRERAARAAESA